jgi:GcrA cell cycle regulator
MGTVNSDWTPDRVEKLKSLFADGLSFYQIASELALTRSAIMGKAHRLGLQRAVHPRLGGRFPRKDSRIKNPGAQNRSRISRIVDGPVVNPQGNPPGDPADQDIPKRQRKTIFTVGREHCKFGVGDPREKGFFFCGAIRQFPLPYCAAHARVCFQPARST